MQLECNLGDPFDELVVVEIRSGGLPQRKQRVSDLAAGTWIKWDNCVSLLKHLDLMNRAVVLIVRRMVETG